MFGEWVIKELSLCAGVGDSTLWLLGYVPIGLANIGTEIDIMICNKPGPATVVYKRFYIRGA